MNERGTTLLVIPWIAMTLMWLYPMDHNHLILTECLAVFTTALGISSQGGSFWAAILLWIVFYPAHFHRKDRWVALGGALAMIATTVVQGVYPTR